MCRGDVIYGGRSWVFNVTAPTDYTFSSLWKIALNMYEAAVVGIMSQLPYGPETPSWALFKRILFYVAVLQLDFPLKLLLVNL